MAGDTRVHTGQTTGLTRAERESRLDPEQLRQLVGLTGHDAASDDFPVLAMDAAVIVCGNASQSAYYYELALGMRLEAYSGPETGNADHRAYVLRAGAARFVLVGACAASSPLVAFQAAHGDAVWDVAWEVADVDRCVAAARAAGIAVLEEPHTLEDGGGSMRIAAIAGFGDTRHSLVDRSRWEGPYRPGFVARQRAIQASPETFIAVDHVACAVEPGGVARWSEQYRRLGFTDMAEAIGDDDDLEMFAQRQGAVMSRNGRIKMGFSEPAAVRKRSGIDVFLGAFGGPGVQHFALATGDIVETATRLRARGVELLDPPDSYYDDPELKTRLAGTRLSVDDLKRHRILVDRDGDDYLLQVFTRPNGDRPTLFMEWIERRGFLGFGKGNFSALVNAAAREAAKA